MERYLLDVSLITLSSYSACGFNPSTSLGGEGDSVIPLDGDRNERAVGLG